MTLPVKTLAALAGLLLVSCQPPDVIVTDAAGAPVEGAAVEPVTASMNLKPVITNAKGEVRIGGSVQPVQWIRVRKAGFQERTSIDYTAPKPIRVILKP